jgi:hypothetical protein
MSSSSISVEDKTIEFYEYLQKLQEKFGVNLLTLGIYPKTYNEKDKKLDNPDLNFQIWFDIIVMEDEKNAPKWLFEKIAYDDWGLEKSSSDSNSFEIAYIKLGVIIDRSKLSEEFSFGAIENPSSTGYSLNLTNENSCTTILLFIRIDDEDFNNLVYKIKYDCTVQQSTNVLIDEKKFVCKSIGEVIDFLNKLYWLKTDPLQVCSDISLMIPNDPIIELLRKSKKVLNV